MGWRIAIVVLVSLGSPAIGFGQDAGVPGRSADHFGIGVFGAAGASTLRAVRVSMPIGGQAGCDLDVGRGSSRADAGRAIGFHVRYRRRARDVSGAGGYWLFGILRLNETRRYWASAGRERWEVVERRTATMPQVGYGWDWQGRRGTRLGLELSTGSEGEAGPRAFARLFVVWGPPLKP